VPVSSVIAVLDLAAGSSKSKSNPLASLIPLLLILAVGYFLFLRPARARQRKAMQTRTNVVPGVEVTTTAGLIATVTAVDDDTVTLEVAPGVHSRYLKGAIARVNTPFETPPESVPDDTPESGTTDETPPGVTSS
jgi:preprotein translocase subunit YajC